MATAPSPRVALITGAESGIGRAVAVALAEGGCDVVIGYLEDADAAATTQRQAQAHGTRACVQPLDVRVPEAARTAVAAALATFGRLDVLVQCAAVSQRKAALSITEAELRAVLDTNLVGPFLLARCAAEAMVAAGRGGRIVNVTSIHDERPLADHVGYTMAKHGLAGMTKTLALELAPYGITVNAVAPGATATAMTSAAGIDVHASPRPEVPLGRLADPREVAAAIAFLCTPAAGYVTGSRLAVDGGLELVVPAASPEAPRTRRRGWRRR